MATLSIAFLLLAGSLIALVLALADREKARLLAHRVKQIAPPGRLEQGAGIRRLAAAARTRSEDVVYAFFAFRMRRRWGASCKPAPLLGIGAAAAVGSWLLARLALHLPMSMAAFGAFFLLPRLVLIRAQHRSDAHFGELLPDAIDMIVRMVRAGLPVGIAIRTVGHEASPPLRGVFAKVADQTEIGLPLDQALARISGEIGNADFRFFAVAVALQQSTGGNLAATLQTLSEIIRKRRAVRMKARATTAEVKISAIVLGSIPFFVTGALLLVAPTYLDALFLDARGNFIVGLALLFLLLAGITMRSMIRSTLAT